ncbi:hypothetical protein PhCBS80983_g02671 [Powellomyces hirtus]|uniref:Sm domain-containing protein n=1 Tax=Powellomyces hirtus TaxID=109895 RepID=A0A507E5K8_9FUNG|nr:hypothetical protein PhCBS80983_g02671 [Powellomyces hirtus]
MAQTWRTEKLQSMLNQRIRISITDGRVFIGYFMCIDKGRNVILASTEEFKDDERRFVGLIMIPGAHLTKVEVEAESQYM